MKRQASPRFQLSRWSNLSLQNQLIVLVVSVIVVVIIVTTGTFIHRDNLQTEQDLQDQGLQILNSIEAAVLDAIYLSDVDSIQTVARNFSAQEIVINVRIYNASGRVLIDTLDSSLRFTLDADPVGIAINQSSQPEIQLLPDRIIVTRRFNIGSQVLGSGWVELSNAELEQKFQSNINQGLGIAIAAISATIILLITIGRQVTKPIKQLAETAEEIGSGQLDKPITIEAGSSETLLLTKTMENMRLDLNELITNLEQRVNNRTAELKIARDEALEARQLAEEHSKLKSEFLSTMSHELRTPLNAIEGFTSIMLSGMGVEINDKARGMIERVNANSIRLLELINDILDISRIEAGRMEITSHPINLAQLLKSWENSVAILAKDKKLDFSIMIAEDLPEEIYSDEDALTKIVINLLSNAVKFTHEGSISLDIKRNQDNLIMAVTDTGIGIPSHAQQYIFDEFRQVDGTSKREYGGTGLGLSLVQKLTIAMGGQVQLESTLKQGSTFTVTLPLAEVEKQRT